MGSILIVYILKVLTKKFIYQNNGLINIFNQIIIENLLMSKQILINYKIKKIGFIFT